MKKILSILILSAFLTHFVGVYVYFFFRLQAIHQEVKAQLPFLPDDKLTRLEFSLADFESSKVDDHEIKVAGKMFDIARTEIVGKYVVVFALQDEAENNLLSLLNEVTKRTSKNSDRAPSSLVQFTSLLFLVPPTSLSCCTVMVCNTGSTAYRFTSSSAIHTIESPPPRHA